jgi:hypothetical protein
MKSLDGPLQKSVPGYLAQGAVKNKDKWTKVSAAKKNKSN